MILDRLATNGGVIDASRPWFRVRGDRSIYRFTRLEERVVRGRARRTLFATGPRGEFRAFNVGAAYQVRGWRVPHYVVRAARPPKQQRGRS